MEKKKYIEIIKQALGAKTEADKQKIRDDLLFELLENDAGNSTVPNPTPLKEDTPITQTVLKEPEPKPEEKPKNFVTIKGEVPKDTNESFFNKTTILAMAGAVGGGLIVYVVLHSMHVLVTLI